MSLNVAQLKMPTTLLQLTRYLSQLSTKVDVKFNS